MENSNLISPNGAPSAPPDGGNFDNASSVSHTGVKVFSSDATVSGESYTSSANAEHAILISGGKVELSDVTVEKSGDDSGDSSDFYGTNAAIFAYNGAVVDISDSNIETDGAHANAVFAYGGATINIENSSIATHADNSGGIMVTGGGIINADSLNVITDGNSAAAIRSDRGGGNINVTGGVYTTNGVGSPAIYSTASINAKEAMLISFASEGVVIEGKNSVTLENVTLDATNNSLNGQSETYKSIFIYQSMSGDATEGEGAFSADNSIIITNKGDHFYVTNTKAQINLTGNVFVQNDETGAFLRVQAGAWGNAGSNGGDVYLNVLKQDVIGDIVADSISTVDFRMKESYFRGAITGEGNVKLTVSSDSVVVLTGDTHVSELTNETSDNSNIYSNGYKLFVNGTEVAVNTDEAPESFLDEYCTADGNSCYDGAEISVETVESASTTASENNSSFPTWGIVAIIVGAVILIGALVTILVLQIRKQKKDIVHTDGSAEVTASNTSSTPVMPDEPRETDMSSKPQNYSSNNDVPPFSRPNDGMN
ncbi:hypothetical protein IKF94_01400 [Candidatus Saccharibacteria bacterium]|nr:hypothetical protein [Candidatus Saccharibacteria bacterium]